MEILTQIAQTTDSPLVAVLIVIIISLSGVIVYLYKHTQKKTVPKWAWERMTENIIKAVENQENYVETVKDEVQEVRRIIDERV